MDRTGQAIFYLQVEAWYKELVSLTPKREGLLKVPTSLEGAIERKGL